MLSNRIRIKSFANGTAQIPRRRILFYRSYAFFVRKALRKPLFQRFLRWLLKRENIDNRLIKDVQIRIFPFKKKNGNNIAGRWNRRGGVSIFPRSHRFYRKLVEEHGSEIARSYVKGRAWATLIHEVLHAKYPGDEQRVRKLTEMYFNIYARNPKTEDFERVIFDILFRQ